MAEIPQPSPEQQHPKSIDLKGLADEFEKHGELEQAAKYRELAKTPPKVYERSRAANRAWLDQELQKANQRDEEELAKRSKSVHNPQFNAQRFGTRTIEIAKSMARKLLGQDNSSSSPTPPTGPVPSGGK